MYIDVSVVHELYSMEAMGVLDPVRDCYTVCICPDLTETLLNLLGHGTFTQCKQKETGHHGN
jgi:hypothetical protein